MKQSVVLSKNMDTSRKNPPHIVFLCSQFRRQNDPELVRILQATISGLAKMLPIAVVAPEPWFRIQWGKSLPSSEISKPPSLLDLTKEFPHVEWLTPGYLYFGENLGVLNDVSLALRLYFSLARLRDRFYFDVIDAQTGKPDGIVAAIIGSWLRCPTVITIREKDNDLFRTHFSGWWLKQALLKVPLILANSESTRQTAFSHGIGPPRKILVLPSLSCIATVQSNSTNAPADPSVVFRVDALVSVANGANFSWPKKSIRRALLDAKNRLETAWIVKRKRIFNKLTRSKNKCGEGQVILVAGVQRSGTNMVMEILDRSTKTDVYHEHDTRAFNNYQLRELAVIKHLHHDSYAPFFVIKSLCELQDIPKILSEFPTAKVVWIVRDYTDVANSMAVSFPSQIDLVKRIAKYKDQTDSWRSAGISDDTHRLFQSIEDDEIDEKSAASLMWYARNILFYEKDLHQMHNVILVKYENLVTNPREETKRILLFLGIDYFPRMTRQIFSTSIRRRKTPKIHPLIQLACETLSSRFTESMSAKTNGHQ